MERAYDLIAGDEPGEDLALVAAQLSRSYWFAGDLERACERVELALDIAEEQDLPGALATALRAKSAVLGSRGHRTEAFAPPQAGLEVALEHDLLEDASTCYFILSDRCFRLDRYGEALALPGRGARTRRQDRAADLRVGGLRPSGPTPC